MSQINYCLLHHYLALILLSIKAARCQMPQSMLGKSKQDIFWSAALKRLKDKLKFTVIRPPRRVVRAQLFGHGWRRRKMDNFCSSVSPLRRRRKINGVSETGSIFLYLGHICCGSAHSVVQGWRISLQRQLAMRYEARRHTDGSIWRCIKHHSEAVGHWPYGFMKCAFATNTWNAMSFPIISQSGCEVAFYRNVI